jgi:hypothetical protein
VLVKARLATAKLPIAPTSRASPWHTATVAATADGGVEVLQRAPLHAQLMPLTVTAPCRRALAWVVATEMTDCAGMDAGVSAEAVVPGLLISATDSTHQMNPRDPGVRICEPPLLVSHGLEGRLQPAEYATASTP